MHLRIKLVLFFTNVIAIQRLIAVLYPFKTSIWITRKCSIVTVRLVPIGASVSLSMEHYIYQRIFICYPFASAAGIIACYFIINFNMMTKKVPAVGVQQIHNIPVLLYSVSITAACMGYTFPYTFYAIMQPVPILQVSIPGFVVYLYTFYAIMQPVPILQMSIPGFVVYLYTIYAITQPVLILQVRIPGFVVYLFYLQIVLDPIFYFSF